jgi:hypothetical protein
MKKTTTSPKWANWMLTPAEFFVFGLAGFVIWVAKVQDRKMAENGYYSVRSHKPNKTQHPQTAAIAFFPTLGSNNFDASDDSESLPVLEISDLETSNTSSPNAISAQKALFKRNYDALIHFQANNLKVEDRHIMMRDGCITYDYLEACFQAASKRPVELMVISDVLANPIMADYIFKAIKERFGVPTAESKMFAQNPLMMLSDWAMFVAQAQR